MAAPRVSTTAVGPFCGAARSSSFVITGRRYRVPWTGTSGRCDVDSHATFVDAVAQVQFNVAMGDREDFLGWFNTTWKAAEVALHNGDAAPAVGTWSEREPVTLFGAWLNAFSPDAAREVFLKLAESFSQAASSEIDLIAADVSGDLAYTVHREITSTTVDGQPRDDVLRVTQVYRREDADWKVVHRHGDSGPEPVDEP